MNMLSVRRNTALLSAVFSLSLLIYILATSAKAPIRVTVTAPYLKITVEINPAQSPSHSNFRQDVAEILIASNIQIQ